MNKLEWFEKWFDSPYYHLLYNNRDQEEAIRSINNILNHLDLKKDDFVLDLGCGKGRHAIHLSSKGFNVTGLDISNESIIHARQFESENLSFFVHDMRDMFRPNYFNAIFSLFTSFGYFKTKKEHEKVIRNNFKGLRKDGVFIIDFMNSYRVKNNLVSEEKVQKEGVLFHIKREIIDGYINKTISFKVADRLHSFTESVYAFSYLELTNMLENNGFKIITAAGDYNMKSFDEKSSNRLILIAIKN